MTSQPPTGSEKEWFPLESNPIVMSSYLEQLGAVPGTFRIADVYGLDEDLLAMVPKEAIAVLMLFPLTERLEQAVKKRDIELRVETGLTASSEESPTDAPYPIPKDLLFMTQMIGNACGTIALLHALGNNVVAENDQPRVGIVKGSFVEQFLSQAKSQGMDAPAMGRFLLESDQLDRLHAMAAVSGQSDLPSEEKDADDPHNRIYHFVAFVANNGYLWELDGRRGYPHRSGPCPDANHGMPLLKAAASAIEWYMQQDPDNIQFGLTALVAGENADD